MQSPRRTPASRRARSQVIDLESAVPPRFRLHRIAWIAWLIYAVVSLGWIFSRETPLDPYWFGELLGSIVVILVLPTFLAWVAWRVIRRSAMVANAAFFIVFGLAVTAEVVRFVRGTEASATSVQSNKPSSTVLGEHQAVEDSVKRERFDTAIGTAYREEMAVVKKRYDDATKELNVANFWSLAKFVPGEPAEACRAAIKQFAQSNRELATFQDLNGTAVRRILAQHEASPVQVQDGVAMYLQNGGARLPLLEKMRDADARLAQLMLEFIDFAESTRARWHFDASEGKVVFDDQALVTRYNELVAQANAVSAEQAQYQKQILAVK